MFQKFLLKQRNQKFKIQIQLPLYLIKRSFKLYMKKLQNPTTFFFKQAENVTETYTKEIDDFVKKLINKDQCQLCKQNYDLLTRIPRIMIHCGHTFCSPCLKKFYMNRRVRCPMCLKLVKHLDKLERLPINHTIFTHLVEKDKKYCQKAGINPLITDASKTLFGEFEKAQKEAHMKERPQRIDPETGLPFCVFHPDRVQHFYCATHVSAGCRVCTQIGHAKSQCKVIDLYEIQDPAQLNALMGKPTPTETPLNGDLYNHKMNHYEDSKINNLSYGGLIGNEEDIQNIDNIDLPQSDEEVDE